MLERVTPNTRCLCAVAAMAFVGDYQIERMNRNVESVSIFFYIRVAAKLSERGFSAEQVPGHSLNRRDVNKSMTRFWCGSGIRSVKLSDRMDRHHQSLLFGNAGYRLHILV